MCKQEGNATFFYNIIFKESKLPDFAEFIARLILFAFAHSLFATNRVKQIFNRLVGKETRFYRLSYNVGSLVMFIWVMATYRTSPVLYFAHGIWSLVMYAAQILVAAIIFHCVRQTGAGDFLGTNQLHSTKIQPQALVTSGYYAHVRHPLYFLSMFFMILNPVVTAQWLLLTIFALLYFIVGGLLEERRLLKTFGEKYRIYQKQVPFMFPVARLFKS